MALGLRVVRGPDWNQGDIDGGEGHLGTVVEVKVDSMTAVVLWDIGNTSHCKIGKNGKCDVRVFDNASVGVIFKEHTCSECQSRHFFGMRWCCKQCKCTNLCSICYFRGKHDQRHEFTRFTAPHMEGVDVPCRATSTSLVSVGMYPKAKVVRGKDWTYQDQDGGAGSVGTVIHIRSFGEDLSHRNAVGVIWPRGQSEGCGYAYRLGYKGKVDLKCTETTRGFEYYREHLPVLDVALIKKFMQNATTSDLKKGDFVCIKLTPDELKNLQQGHGGFSIKMEEIIGKTGIIDGFTESGDVITLIHGDRWVLNPKALSKVITVSIGDTVRIKDDYDAVKTLQTGHGGWNDDMKEVLGKVGKIVRVTSRKDVVVAFGKKYWVFNKACLIPAPGEKVYEIKPEEDFSLSRAAGLTDGLGLLLAQLLLTGAPLHAAPEQFLKEAAAGNTSMVVKMVKGEPNLCNLIIKGTTALVCACFEGHLDVVKVLLQAGAKTDMKDQNGNTALLASVASEHEVIVKLLLEAGADVNLCNEDGRTPLHVAAKVGLENVVKMLISKRCNVNAQDAEGNTAFHDAVAVDLDNIVIILLETPGVDFSICTKKGFNYLHYATMKGNKIAVEKITSKKPTMTDIATAKGITALHIAAINNRTEIGNILLIKGRADTEKKTNDGRTALHLAAIEAYYDVVKLLLDFNANPSAVDSAGNTPLHCVLGGQRSQPLIVMLMGRAAANDKAERIKVASLLVKFGAKIDARNRNGQQAIHMTKDDEVKSAVKNVAEEERRNPSKRGRDRPTSGRKEAEMFQQMIVPCFVCFRQTGIVTTLPCRHRCLCPRCCFQVQECPVCLKLIEQRLDPNGQQIVPIDLGDLCKVQ